MESNSRALLLFTHAAVVARTKVEVFVLGTRLGDDFRQFNERWGIRGLASGAVIVVLSDGWGRGDRALLGGEMQRLQRVAHQIVWVNPLKATPGYEPLAAGVAAALSFVDRFVEGHSYACLEQLASLLAGTES